MNAHLNDQQFGDFVLGLSNAESAQHLDMCDSCRGETEKFRNAITECRESAHTAAERGEVFWVKQRL